MPNRVSPGQEKILPLLSFKVPIEITFSIGTTERLRNQITGDIANLNDDFTIVCRKEILFKKLGLKNKVEIDSYFDEAIKLAKRKIYNDLGICRQKNFGKDFMINELLKYIERRKKEVNSK
jgi:hypothetical protein